MWANHQGCLQRCGETGSETNLQARFQVVNMAFGKKGYMLAQYTQEPTLPPAFVEFVKSFELLSPEQNTAAAQQNITGVFSLWAIWGGRRLAVYEARRSKADTKRQAVLTLRGSSLRSQRQRQINYCAPVQAGSPPSKGS
jgi:hypothetical protein